MSMTATTSSPPAAQAVPWALFADLGRQQLVTGMQGACALFRGFEAMRQVQQQAAHASARQYGAAVQKLQGPCTPQQLLEIQTELVRLDMEAATRYWQDLAGTAMEMQTQIANCAVQSIDSGQMLEMASALDAHEGAAAPRPRKRSR
jgi:hypothetical protein